MRDAARLSCAEFAFPALPFARRLALVELLGFERVDVELLVPLPPAPLREEQVAPLRGALAASSLAVADLFFVLGGGDFAAGALNQRAPELREAHRAAFASAVQAARAIGAPGVTILPGVPWPDDPAGGWECAVQELRWRVETAGAAGVETRIEAHIGSLVSTPELAASLLASVPGLRLTLDPTHFTMQAIASERIVPLAPLAGHVHVRASRPGAIQVAWEDDDSDLGGFLAALDRHGYAGAVCVEYVPHRKWGCDAMDVLSATVATRAALLARELR